MRCSKCGNFISEGTKFCTQCGHNVAIDNYNFNNKKIVCFFVSICGLVLIVIGFVIYNNQNSHYYFSDIGTEKTGDEGLLGNDKKEEGSVVPKKNSFETVIVYDKKYTGVDISTKADAVSLIEEDSLSQKKSCPTSIKNVENEMIKKYGVYAVNLCEMSVEFAKEIEKVIEKIYNDYPAIRGNLTNLTLYNGTMDDQGVIAAYGPYFPFAYGNDDSYPRVYKMQMILNSSYFLNEKRLQSSVSSADAHGWFPPNCTKASPVAHELGHYLSFVAMMKNYNIDSMLIETKENYASHIEIIEDFVEGNFSKKMLTEAYENYKRDHKGNKESFDDFRGSISGYALAKNDSGDFIYDETIAEAFHDCYLNGENAKDASKYIEQVLKKYASK